MEKQQDSDNIKKSSSSANYFHPTFSELSKSNAIHGALMGNLLGFREGSFLYRTSNGVPVHVLTQLITYSRDNIRIYNVETFYEQTKSPTRANIDYKLNLTHEVPLFGEIKNVGMIYNREDGNKGYLVILFSENKVYLQLKP